MKFYIVDAFTTEVFGGNPAGVVILPDGADFPSDEVMVKTAAELRYSETAFIKNLGGGEFNIRYFTPAASAPSKHSFMQALSRITASISITLCQEILKYQ